MLTGPPGYRDYKQQRLSILSNLTGGPRNVRESFHNGEKPLDVLASVLDNALAAVSITGMRDINSMIREIAILVHSNMLVPVPNRRTRFCDLYEKMSLLISNTQLRTQQSDPSEHAASSITADLDDPQSLTASQAENGKDNSEIEDPRENPPSDSRAVPHMGSQQSESKELKGVTSEALEWSSIRSTAVEFVKQVEKAVVLAMKGSKARNNSAYLVVLDSELHRVGNFLLSEELPNSYGSRRRILTLLDELEKLFQGCFPQRTAIFPYE